MEKRDYGVIGLGQFGLEAARTMTELGYNVLALDKDADRVQRAARPWGLSTAATPPTKKFWTNSVSRTWTALWSVPAIPWKPLS